MQLNMLHCFLVSMYMYTYCSMYSLRRDSASRTYFWILPPSLSEELYVTFFMLLGVLPFKLKIENIASRQAIFSFRNACVLLGRLWCGF